MFASLHLRLLFPLASPSRSRQSAFAHTRQVCFLSLDRRPIHRSAIRRVYAFVSIRRADEFSPILGRWSLIRSILKSVHSTMHICRYQHALYESSTSYSSLALPLCRAYLARLNRLTALQIARILSQMSCSSSSYLRVESALRALATSASFPPSTTSPPTCVLPAATVSVSVFAIWAWETISLRPPLFAVLILSKLVH